MRRSRRRHEGVLLLTAALALTTAEGWSTHGWNGGARLAGAGVAGLRAPTVLADRLASHQPGFSLHTPAKERRFDSIDRFEKDIAVVLNDLRRAATDPAVPALFRRDNNGGPSFSKTWTLADWRRHASRRRYWDLLLGFPRSRMLRRVLPQWTVLLVWTALAVRLHDAGRTVLHISLTPLSLVSTFVAALLTLRSNQGLDRLAQGRAAMRSVLWNTRHMAQLVASSVYPHDPDAALRCLRHVSLFGWMLKNFMRGEELNADVSSRHDDMEMRTFCSTDLLQLSGSSLLGLSHLLFMPLYNILRQDSDLLHAVLSPTDAMYILTQRKKPVAIVARLYQLMASLEGKVTTAAQICILETIQRLNDCITTCERIRASPIPPLYTAHTGLLLTCYLFCLPLALHGSNLMAPMGTVVTTAVVGYAMLGLDEISHILEQPFQLMPLYQQSKTIMTDVADAAECRMPSLPSTSAEETLTGSDAAIQR